MSSDKSISFGCGTAGPVLSAAIILARAMCGSVPMEEWSAWSWFLMTLPATIPAFAVVLGFLLWLAGHAIERNSSLRGGKAW